MKHATLQRAGKPPLLSVQEVSYTYPNRNRALNQISLDIPRSSKTVILGANGAGKSTLFLHLNGILKPGEGRVLLEGQPVEYNRNGLSELRSQVGLVFQDPDSQLFSVNVYQDISFGPMNLKLPSAQVRDQVDKAMEITRTTVLRERPIHQLSYGEKKRVAIAGVLAMDPAVIILDEPTAFLDPCLTEEMTSLFEWLYGEGKTLVISTHDMNLAYRWADYAYVIKDGQIAGEGNPVEIFQDQELLRTNNLDMPWVLKVYRQLQSNGLIEQSIPVPRSEEELFAALSQAERPFRFEAKGLRVASK